MGLTVAELEQNLTVAQLQLENAILEIEEARGTEGTLDDRLSVSLNPDGTIKPSELNLNFVADSSVIVASAVNGAWIILEGDRSTVYVTDRRVLLNSNEALTSYVQSSVYNAETDETTITFSSAVGVVITAISFSFKPNMVSQLYLSDIKGATLATYANNAAALAGGLVAGQFYQTGGDPSVVAVVI